MILCKHAVGHSAMLLRNMVVQSFLNVFRNCHLYTLRPAHEVFSHCIISVSMSCSDFEMNLQGCPFLGRLLTVYNPCTSTIKLWTSIRRKDLTILPRFLYWYSWNKGNYWCSSLLLYSKKPMSTRTTNCQKHATLWGSSHSWLKIFIFSYFFFSWRK